MDIIKNLVWVGIAITLFIAMVRKDKENVKGIMYLILFYGFSYFYNL